MHKPIAQRIAELEERKRSLMARLSRQQRARDTRRKILLGSLVLHHIAHSDDAGSARQLTEWLRQNLPGFLIREQDRALFNDILEPDTLPASPSSQMSSAVSLPKGVDTEPRL